MKLSKTIIINPPPYSSDGKIIQPPPIKFDYLDVTYNDNPTHKVYYASIKGIPSPIFLYIKDEYDQHAYSLNASVGQQRLLSVLGDNPAVVLRQLFPKTLEENPYGPGTVLSQMIKKLGINIHSGCSCKEHAIEMNIKGNDWCEQNIDTIINWLRTEANKRKIPFIDSLGKIIVRRAIKKSRKLLANEPVPNNDEELDDFEF